MYARMWSYDHTISSAARADQRGVLLGRLIRDERLGLRPRVRLGARERTPRAAARSGPPRGELPPAAPAAAQCVLLVARICLCLRVAHEATRPHSRTRTRKAHLHLHSIFRAIATIPLYSYCILILLCEPSLSAILVWLPAVLATSDIDYDVKLWAPFAEHSTFDAALANEVPSPRCSSSSPNSSLSLSLSLSHHQSTSIFTDLNRFLHTDLYQLKHLYTDCLKFYHGYIEK